jgi:hypothetical protein
MEHPERRPPMVMLATDCPVPTFRLVDDAGASVGRIVLPVTDRLSGVGAETIYLRRATPFRSRKPTGAEESKSPLTEH